MSPSAPGVASTPEPSGLRFVVPAVSTTADGWTVQLTAERAGWRYSSLHVLDLPPGGSRTFQTGQQEMLVVPLRGAVHVACGAQQLSLTGRADVFSGPTDMAYLPRDTTVTLSSPADASIALPGADARTTLPLRHIPAAAAPVELRGAGSASRQVNNLATPGVLDTDRLIACEVLTPGGNTSSWPPHRHDRTSDSESELEEIYYVLIAEAGSRSSSAAGDATAAGHPTAAGMGYLRVYGESHRPIDVLTEVRSGDIVLVPHGWHGPAVALPGYDMYYLNVMAGPEPERAWRIVDDPAHGWVRGTWPEQAVDARLPFYPRTIELPTGAPR